MTEEEMEEAIERIAGAMSAEAAPEKMTPEEAIDFYRCVESECDTWIQALREDLGDY